MVLGRRVGGRVGGVERLKAEIINVGVAKRSRGLGIGLGRRNVLLIVASDDCGREVVVREVH